MQGTVPRQREHTKQMDYCGNSAFTACNRTDRGVKKANYAVLRETPTPAILIECAFMTN
ncbi:N-acetylmuramoyl-L-alanine amidase [Sporosarcina psychrophila]|uniref:N-acetylmuramoyl-L-alanine amidase n=1 Tax=Sporosarcina psychrophila TaxID=1476 RepID=UPI0009EDAA41